MSNENESIAVSKPGFHIAFGAFENIVEMLGDSQIDGLRDEIELVQQFFMYNEPSPDHRLNAASDRLMALTSELQVDHDLTARDVSRLCAELANFYDVNPEVDRDDPFDDYDDASPDYPPFPPGPFKQLADRDDVEIAE